MFAGDGRRDPFVVGRIGGRLRSVAQNASHGPSRCTPSPRSTTPPTRRSQRPVASPSLPARPRLLEVSHVAHRLSVSQEYVRKLLRGNKLAAIRLGGR